METLGIIQARSSSTRLPNKVLKTIDGIPMILYITKSIQNCKTIDKVVVATSTEQDDDELSNILENSGVNVFRGELNDVLSRFYSCAKHYSAKHIVRLTGDCPLIDCNIVDELIQTYLKENIDYMGNTLKGDELTVPDGFDVEVFNYWALEEAYKNAELKSEREHVTPWMRKSDSGVNWRHFKHKKCRSYYKLSVDSEDDFRLAEIIIKRLNKSGEPLDIDNIVDYLQKNPQMAEMNKGTTRNEGYKKSVDDDYLLQIRNSEGQKLWKRARQLIPGGNMLLSKRSEMFLPEQWPAYYSKAKGCHVWDLDNQKYLDMNLMGVGTTILGYGNDEVDSYIRKTIDDGNMSSLNAPEEVYLAEKLVDLHNWSDMVRFARTGGEANAIAIRIARAASGKDAVAICGYHGWHDWYIATNLGDTSKLGEHLLPGLSPKGVPEGLKGTVIPFSYNNIEQLEEISDTFNLGAIKMEVERNQKPKEGYLEAVRELCDRKNIILIFDECTSGFRETNGGLHKKYGVEPDMAIFGKAMGNGYAITAVIGKSNIMQYAQETFISSTFWTERIGSQAGLATLSIMERERSWETITRLGKELKKIWYTTAKRSDLTINIFGLDALAAFSFDSKQPLKCKTFLTQQMLKNKILAGTSCYLSVAHKRQDFDRYAEVLETTFQTIADYENDGRDIGKLLHGPECHSGFKRLN